MERRSTLTTAMTTLAGCSMLLQGCATTKTLRASWYQQIGINKTNPELDEIVWRIAFVNREPKPIRLGDISLGTKDKKVRVPGFTLKDNTQFILLNPSQILVVKLDQDSVPPCEIPVVVYVRNKPNGPWQSIPLGGLPSFLTEKQTICDAELYRMQSKQNSGYKANTDQKLPLRAHIFDE